MSTITIQVPNPYNLSQMIPREITFPPTHGRLMKEAHEAVERRTIAAVMHSLNYNQSHAAKALGITRSTLFRRLLKYELPTINPTRDTPNQPNLMYEPLRQWKRMKFHLQIFKHNRQNLDNADLFAYRLFHDHTLLSYCRICPIPITISTDSDQFIGKILRDIVEITSKQERYPQLDQFIPILEAYILEYDNC